MMTAERTRLAALGDAMARHRGAIQAMQWVMVAVYLVLVAVPAVLPIPDDTRHIWNSLVLFAQFAFWGVWWPFVMISMLIMGRAWCGVFCPEGTMTEWASRHGLGRAIPAWLRWKGWPFVAFVCTTVYGQLITVYEYPKAALLILGASTVMALGIGLVYGRGLRVWCRYLCPASGVFSLLSRLAPLHFRVDARRWRSAPRTPAVACAPLVDVRRVSGGGACQMCGRCSGHRGAVTLSLRPPGSEVTTLPVREVSAWEIVLLLFGVMGVASGAFQWTVSPLFIDLKQALAGLLIDRGITSPMTISLPWWLLTHSEETGEVFTLLDGFCTLVYIAGTALALGGLALAGLAAAARLVGRGQTPWRLGYSLIPAGAMGLVIGLTAMTLSQLRGEGLDFAWVGPGRAALLVLGLVWSGASLWKQIPRPVAWLAGMIGPLAHAGLWTMILFVW